MINDYEEVNILWDVDAFPHFLPNSGDGQLTDLSRPALIHNVYVSSFARPEQ